MTSRRHRQVSDRFSQDLGGGPVPNVTWYRARRPFFRQISVMLTVFSRV